MMRRAPKPSRRRSGFTLVELMVAMTAGLAVILAAYQISRTSSRMFTEQIRRAETQMTLRSASEMMRRDIGRAGYFGVRSTTETGCPTTLGALGAAADNAAPRQISAVLVRLDGNGRPMLFLTGNFTSSDQFLVTYENAAPTQLTLQTFRDAYRRAFIDPASGAFLPGRFAEAFAPDPTQPLVEQGRMLAIQDLEKRLVFLRDLTGVNAPAGVAPTLQFASPLPIGAGAGGCSSGNALAVAPISMVRYAVEDPSGDAELALAAGTTYMTGKGVGAAAGNRWALVRREVDLRTIDNPTPTSIPGTARILLDFLSADDFSVEAIRDTTPFAAQPTLLRTVNPETLSAAQLADLRSLVIQLVVNSAERADAFGANPMDPNARLEQRRAESGRRFMRFEVFMPNLARNPQTP